MRKRALLTSEREVALAHRGAPADELIARGGLPGRGAEAEHGQRLAVVGTHEVAHLGAGQGVVAEIVIARDEGVPQPSLGAAGDGLDAQRAHRLQRCGGLEQRRGSVSGEGAMGFLGPGRLRAGGSAMTPSRCMRSSATRALMSLSPPSGLRQSRRSHTARDSAARFNGGSCSAIRVRMSASSASEKTRAQ